MLSDFLMLEVYFGGADSAQELEKAYRNYGCKVVQKALKLGDLRLGMTSSRFGGKALCWLSETGREKARLPV